MPTWVKILLLLAALVLLFVLVLALGAWWFIKNEGRIKEMGQRAQADGKAHGAHSDADGCITEGLARLDGTKDALGRIGQGIFVEACIEVAKRPPGFCDDVPKRDEYLKSAMWAQAECERRKHAKDQYCNSIMQEVQRACWPPKLKRAPPSEGAPLVK